MNKANSPVDGIKIGLGIALLAALTGCVGYVDGGYGGAVVVPGPPDVYFLGGPYYERGRDVHVYSHRGFESRASVIPAGRGPERRQPAARPAKSSSAHSAGHDQGRRP